MPDVNDLGSNDFDMSAAVDSLSDELGFESETPQDQDDLQVEIGETDLQNAENANPKPQADSPPTPSAIEPPKTWRKEALEQWNALPEVVKAEVLKREEDIFRGLEVYRADATFGKSLKSVLDPYMPILQQYNIDPAAQVANLMQAHHTLALGAPEQKVAFMRQLAQEYGIDLGELSGAGAPFVDPAVDALQKELQAVKSTLSARERAEAQQRLQSIQTEIEQFASDPANEHFDSVANDIAALLKAGTAKDLKDAYEKAVWANPVTRAKLVAKQQADAAAQAKAEAAKRAAAAKSASSVVVRAKPSSASGTAPIGSMDDTMQETLAAIQARGG